MKIILETPRLLIKTLDKNYAKKVLAYNTENKDFFKSTEPLKSEDFYTVKAQKKILNFEQKELRNGTKIHFYIFLKTPKKVSSISRILTSNTSNKIIGSITFSNIIRGVFQSCFLGYKLHKDYIRNGFMEEALKESIGYMFKYVGLHRIEANIMPDNYPSLELAKKLGFVSEGYAPKYLKINGKWEDHIHFSMINENV